MTFNMIEIARYWNPVDKKWETAKETMYLKPEFVSWEEYKNLKNKQ